MSDRDNQSPQDPFRQPYLEYLTYRHRSFDVKGLSRQGPFTLELERVFVELSISPEANPSSTPIYSPKSGFGEKQGIWEWLKFDRIDNMVILGPPGSGKTTLLKYMTLALAHQDENKNPDVPDNLPVLLFLRDHTKAIVENPKVRLVELLYASLDMLEVKPPENWFETHLKDGSCLMMFDGLDEVADPAARRQVVTWVEQQMAVHGKNRFIITSRPHGYRSNPIGDVTQLEVRPFDRTQVEQFVGRWYLTRS